MQLPPFLPAYKGCMRYELILLSLMMGMSVSLAQSSKAVGVYFSKDGIKALSTRFGIGDNPYLSVALLGGLGPAGSYVAGLSFQHLFEVSGGCASGACYRRSTAIQPYIDAGLRMLRQQADGQMSLQGVIGGGLLLPVGPIEAFVQVHGLKPLSEQGLSVDVGGGIRIRF